MIKLDGQQMSKKHNLIYASKFTADANSITEKRWLPVLKTGAFQFSSYKHKWNESSLKDLWDSVSNTKPVVITVKKRNLLFTDL